jgi:putative SOS response-associated peptidase YedK
MCSHYQAVKKAAIIGSYFRARGIEPPKPDMWPKYEGPFVRRPPEWESADKAVPEPECAIGRWGLVSALTTLERIEKARKLSIFNARSKSAAKSFTCGNPWRKAQHCIIPAECVFESEWRKAVPTRFTRADGAPLGKAGLWDPCGPSGFLVESFTMLTINADQPSAVQALPPPWRREADGHDPS